MAKEQEMEQLFEDALDISDRHLSNALMENEELAPYVAVAMIESAVNQAVDMTSPDDVISILQDLISQIEEDAGEGDAGSEDGEGDEDE